MTEKLYDYNGYMTEFDAEIISCENTESGFRTVLDRTAFFPTEGGQMCDSGYLNDTAVFDVTIENGVIYHHTHAPFKEGDTVHGTIDFKERYRKMQNHSGEHIICGIAHKLYGCENVGFHLGADYVTMDLDKPLEEEEIRNLEVLANEAVYANVPIKAYYPTQKELKATDFRSKEGIKGEVRLVIIEGYDICACCAPHVARTGEVGIIKILDRINHKGGVRLNILCGSDALSDYHERYERNVYISNLLSARQEEVCGAVDKILSDMAELRAKLGEKSKEITRLYLDNIKETDENICIFVKDMSNGELRHLANGAKEKTSKLAGVFCQSGSEGYSYIIGSDTLDLKSIAPLLNEALKGRGGGNSTMIQGSVNSTEAQIRRYFEKI